LNEAARSSHYTVDELARLDFATSPPDLSALSIQWKEMLKIAHVIIDTLPVEHVGQCLLDNRGKLFFGDIQALEKMMKKGAVQWHKGALGGIFPVVRNKS
jgi:hypothetical protein